MLICMSPAIRQPSNSIEIYQGGSLGGILRLNSLNVYCLKVNRVFVQGFCL